MNSLSLEKDPDPLSPITPGFLGPVTTRFNCVGGQQIHNPTKKITFIIYGYSKLLFDNYANTQKNPSENRKGFKNVLLMLSV